MKKTSKRDTKNNKERSILNKKSVSSSSFFSILKFNIAIALSILLFSLIVNAGDVIVESGKLDVSSNLYVDDAGNVGIGTTGPGSRLHISGGGVTVGPFAATTDEGGIDVTGPIAELGFVRRNLASWTGSQAAGDRFVWYNPDGTARLWTHQNGDLVTVTSSGNVGIGTTSPSGKLQVAGDIRADTLESHTAGPLEFGYYNPTDFTFCATTNCASTALIVKTTSGNVGIGTTNPPTKLYTKNAAANSVVGVDSGDGATARYSAVDFYDNAVSKWGIGKNPANDFYIDQAGVGNAITILSSNRNVGVGATNPSEKLDVAGNVKGTGLCIGTDCRTSWPSGTSSSSLLPSGTTGQTLRHDGNNWVANSILQNNGIDRVTIERGNEATLKIKNTEAGGKDWALVSSGSLGGLGGAGKFSIYDASTGISRLLIDTNGNVGIGTTGPITMFQVGSIASGASNARALIAGSASTDSQILELKDSAGTAMSLFYQNSGGDAQFDVRDTTGTAKAFITANGASYLNGGNVGIGTTTPTEKLHVLTSGTTKIQISAGADQLAGIQLGDGTQSWNLFGRFDNPTGGNANRWEFQAGGTPVVAIQYDGNVGIGTTNPGAKLDVSASQRWHFPPEPGVYNMKLDFQDNGASNVQWNMVQRNANIDYNVLSFKTGNVGIGTTPTSWAKLDVAGDMSVRGASNWDGTNVAVITSEAVGKPLAMKARGGVAPDLVVTPSGNVGIGMTNPEARLQVGGELRADWAHIAWHRINWGDVENTCGGSHTGGGGRTHVFGTDIHGGCGDAGWIRYYSDGGGNENLRLEMRIQNDGDDDIYIRGSGGTTTGTGDLAELYYSTEELQLGDVVVMDSEHPTAVKKSSMPYQAGLVGVTSAKPFALLMATNEHILDNTSYKPTSLAGKIIVKVSLENGVIKAGDALTSSSMPGYAMKATRAGQIIGYAFEGFDGSERSSRGVEQMYHDVSVGCADCEQRLRVFERSAKSSPGIHQTGVMTMLVNPGYWDPGTELRVQQDKVLKLENENLQLKGQLLHLEKRVAVLEQVQ